MQAPYARTIDTRPARDAGLRIARMIVVLYFCACALHGLIRLRAAGSSAEVFGAVLRLWYGEAIVFGAVWGLAALAHGMIRGGGGDRTPRLREEPRRSSMLRALERDRGR